MPEIRANETSPWILEPKQECPHHRHIISRAQRAKDQVRSRAQDAMYLQEGVRGSATSNTTQSKFNGLIVFLSFFSSLLCLFPFFFYPIGFPSCMQNMMTMSQDMLLPGDGSCETFGLARTQSREPHTRDRGDKEAPNAQRREREKHRGVICVAWWLSDLRTVQSHRIAQWHTES